MSQCWQETNFMFKYLTILRLSQKVSWGGGIAPSPANVPGKERGFLVGGRRWPRNDDHVPACRARRGDSQDDQVSVEPKGPASGSPGPSPALLSAVSGTGFLLRIGDGDARFLFHRAGAPPAHAFLSLLYFWRRQRVPTGAKSDPDLEGSDFPWDNNNK